MRKAPVFPVPFLALAIILFLAMMRGIDSSCTGVGTRYPDYASAKMICSLSFNSLKFLYLVALISCMH